MSTEIESHNKCNSAKDVAIWAAKFCKLNPNIEESNMTGWIANAIESAFSMGMDFAFHDEGYNIHATEEHIKLWSEILDSIKIKRLALIIQ